MKREDNAEMIKNKFYKNLYQSISFFSVIVIFVFFLLLGFIVSLNYEYGSGWILLVIAVSLIILFFLFGFYWIFQRVIINEEGVKIFFLKKVIKKYTWDEVESIEEANIMRNPALNIKMMNGSEVHLDKRKAIIRTIEFYSKNK